MKVRYRQGTQITTIEELMKQDFIMVHNKVYHKGWFRSWTFNYVLSQLERGQIYEAYKPVFRDYGNERMDGILMNDMLKQCATCKQYCHRGCVIPLCGRCEHLQNPNLDRPCNTCRALGNGLPCNFIRKVEKKVSKSVDK